MLVKHLLRLEWLLANVTLDAFVLVFFRPSVTVESPRAHFARQRDPLHFLFRILYGFFKLSLFVAVVLPEVIPHILDPVIAKHAGGAFLTL